MINITWATLTYLINVHARLTILDFFSTLHALLYNAGDEFMQNYTV